MIIGIDVGGTHADGVLLEAGEVVQKKKVRVDHARLSESLIQLLEHLTPGDRTKLERIQLSTTLCTNALVSGRLERVGMFVQAGPGICPAFLSCGSHTWFLDGSIDHRGQVVKDFSDSLLDKVVKQCLEEQITSVAIVTKFSHRNNEHEIRIRERLGSAFQYVSMGHTLSGLPNFPRRVYTTWLNSGLKSEFDCFYQAMTTGLEKLQINCPVYMLKADGGTIPLTTCCEQPCQSIHSGPSASVMGALALVEKSDRDSVILDVGGTTTDIALLANGVPLLEPYGITVAGRPTLIRALQTKSVGLGGDSTVRYEDGTYVIGPDRQGPPMAFGGDTPTPADALILLDSNSDERERNMACQAMQLLRGDVAAEQTATELMDLFVDLIGESVEAMIEEVFSRPVYTVSALLERKRFVPEQVILIGGPARLLKDEVEKQLGLPCLVPDHYEVANAVGSARARITFQVSLYADTSAGQLSIPELSHMESTSPMFSMEDGEERILDAAKEMGGLLGMSALPDVDLVERLEMNCVRGFSTTGKIISLKGQIRPGLMAQEECE